MKISVLALFLAVLVAVASAGGNGYYGESYNSRGYGKMRSYNPHTKWDSSNRWTIHVPTRRHEIHAAPVTEVGVGAVVTEESRSGVDVYNYLDLRMWLHQIQFITVTTVRPTRDFRMNKIHDVFGRDVPVVQLLLVGMDTTAGSYNSRGYGKMRSYNAPTKWDSFNRCLSCQASKQVTDKMFLGLSMQYTSSHKTHVVALDRGHWIHVTLEGVALDRNHWIHVTLEGVALDRGHWIHVTLEGVALDRGHWIHVTLEGVALDRGHWIHVTLGGVALDRGHWIHVILEGVALDRGHWIHVTLEGVALDRSHWIHVTLEGVALDRGHWIHVTLEGVALDSCSEGKQFEALASTTRNSPVVALQWIAEQLVQRVEEPAVESFLDSCRV
eukprot:Em0017g696a